MSNIGKVQYRVTPLVRYQVTRYHETAGGLTGGNEQKGIYDNADVAYEVAYALCKEEHERLGFPPGDERIQYPRHMYDTNISGGFTASEMGAIEDQRLLGAFDNSLGRK